MPQELAQHPNDMTEQELAQRIDTELSHIWMVRTFLKHCEEAEEDDDLRDVFRGLYDYMLSLGDKTDDPPAYIKQARKKLKKLKEATDLYLEIQPEISNHTNFQMAARSLTASVEVVSDLLAQETTG